MAEREAGNPYRGVAWRVALIYLVLGLAWIFGSDLYIHYTSADPAAMPVAQMIKGSAFVVGSSLVIYGLVRWLNRAGELERGRRESAERNYRALVRSMPDAVFTIEPESGRILDANAAAESLFRLPRGKLIGQERAFHTDTTGEDFLAYQEERLRTGQARAVLTMIRGDGSRFPADVSSAVFRDETGGLRASCVIRDITEQAEREQTLEASQARLSELTNLQQAILNAVFAHIALVDDKGIIRFANERWLKGTRTGALPALGAGLESDYLARCGDHQGPEAPTARRIAEELRLVSSGKKERSDFEFPHEQDEQRRWRRIAITPFAAEGQKGVVVAHLDVTERRAAEARRRLVDAAFQSTGDAILICDEDLLILDANDAYMRVTGFERRDALESRPTFLEIGEQARVVGKALATEGHWRGDLLQRRVTGETFVSWATVNVVRQEKGEPQRVVITFSDVSELREARDRIQHLSYHDPVTNLPNRAALEEWFSENVQKGPAGRAMALVYLDLDRFKIVNEAFGHGVGDELLKEAARRLRALTQPRDALARLGGDEFVFIADGVTGEGDALRRAQQMLDALAKPIRMESQELFCSASAGVTLYPEDGLSLEELLREADAAVDKVKSEGRRGGLGRFQQPMKHTVNRQMRVEHELRGAIQREELQLAYQPIVRLEDSILCGVEALVRWESPELGIVSPEEFIPVAEDSGLITEIGHWVLYEACGHLKRWKGLTTRLEHMSVNISMAQFQQPGLVEQVETILKRHGLPGEALVLEITESVMMMDPGWTGEVLDRLKHLGIRVAIDDFGTGYSSMTYLRDLPVDYLKLDRSFVHRLPDSEADAHIMKCVINLAHRLGMRVVAEGIETEAQLDLLREWSCNEGQGYLFERPQGESRVEAMLQQGALQLPHSGEGTA